MQIPLMTSASVTFDSNGNGTVSLSPQISGTSWNVKRISISTSSGPAGTLFYLYMNHVTPASQIDATYSGDQDTSETNIDMKSLDTIFGVWKSGKPGAVGTMVLTGTVETGR